MIDEQLLLSRGKELDLNVDAEVVRQLDEIRKQNHLDSMEALEKAVRRFGHLVRGLAGGHEEPHGPPDGHP